MYASLSHELTLSCGCQMEAGSDTTASMILSFLLAMITHPSCLKKCQEEVDAQCGTSRSPSADDINNLPYIRACMNEVSDNKLYIKKAVNLTEYIDTSLASCGRGRYPARSDPR